MAAAPYLDHVTGPLERWDLIAYRYYGDAGLYGPVLEANRGLFVSTLSPIPAVLPAGLALRIPIQVGPRRPAPEDLPPWFR